MAIKGYATALFAIALLAMASAHDARALSQQDQLRGLVDQLHQATAATNAAISKPLSDTIDAEIAGLEAQEDAIRKRIFGLVRTMNPQPVPPAEFNEVFSKGIAQFKSATGRDDYHDARESFERAAELAPWVPGVYFNLGIAWEKLNQFTTAIRWFTLYLAAAPDASDAAQVEQRIGRLKNASQHAGDVFAARWLDSLRDRFFGSYRAWTCTSCSWGTFLARDHARQLQPIDHARFTIIVDRDTLVISAPDSPSPWLVGRPDCGATGICVLKWHDLRNGVESIGDINESQSICRGRAVAALWFRIGGAPQATGEHDYWTFDNICG